MNTIYEIGPFRLDATAGLLTQGGVPVPLGSRGVAVLAALVRRPNEYVQKGDIIDAVWPDVVVGEANLTVQISAIRRVLAQAPGGECWVETLNRRGYRFVGPVTEFTNNPPRGADGRNSNLPEPLTSFVGRERELVEIKQLLPRTRLLTLVGVGGIGKTRLALQVAAEVLDAYRDGVWLVELASVADPGLVPQTVATVLGLDEKPGMNLTQSLTEHLASRHLLLLLDNAEHLAGACALLADAVLRRCAQVVILITSRERLGLSGESTYRVPSMSMPDPERDATAASLAPYESVRLFIERARLNTPHFAVTNDNAPALASVCRRLDGIPLAIELAAARVRSMSVEELNQRLDQCFHLLTGGSRMAPRRQQTLRATIDWSYDLLTDAEKVMLRRVSVFSGGWTLEAAKQVCVGEEIDGWEALDLLTSLSDKNILLTEERGGVTRYRLLETVRQYAQERQQETGEEARLQDRHFAYFLGLAEDSGPYPKGYEQQEWLDRMETEHDNLAAALAWCVAPGGDAARGLRLAVALGRFWEQRSYLVEGRGWLSKLLAAAPREPTGPARARALNWAGTFEIYQGDYPVAHATLEEALELSRELDDRSGIAESLHNLGSVAHLQGDYASARALYEDSVAIRRELGERWQIANTLCLMGRMATDQGDYPTAQTLCEESLAIRRELGWPIGLADALTFLGTAVQERGDSPSALALLSESVALCWKLRHRDYLAESLQAIASAVSAMGSPRRAALIFGSAERLREEVGAAVWLAKRQRFDRQVAAARAALGDDAAFDLAWREGRAMSLDQAIEYALEKHDA